VHRTFYNSALSVNADSVSKEHECGFNRCHQLIRLKWKRLNCHEEEEKKDLELFFQQSIRHLDVLFTLSLSKWKAPADRI